MRSKFSLFTITVHRISKRSFSDSVAVNVYIPNENLTMTFKGKPGSTLQDVSLTIKYMYFSV